MRSIGSYGASLTLTLLAVMVCAPAHAGALELPNPLAPDDIKSRIAATGDAEKHKSDVVQVIDYTDVIVRSNGIGTARHQVVTKVLKDGGIRSQAAQRFPFDPHTNRLDLIAVRVYRADGQVEDVPVSAAVEQPQPAGAIYWGTRQYVVSVPRLEVGDAVETISAMTGFNVAYLGAEGDAAEVNALGEPLNPPVEGHWHDEVDWWSSVPVVDKRFSVRIHKSQPLQYEIYNGELRTSVLFDGDYTVYSFERKDITPFTHEPNMEPVPNVAPKLLLATLPTWEDKSRWLSTVSEPTFAADDAIRAKVAEIIRDKQTDEEKWTALNHWVAENIRYAGTSRGMCEGYTNHPVIETFHDRMGVCKDKAGMLVGMLRVAGYDSFLVMTMARQRVDRVPADQFNHAVTCVRKKDGTLVLLDPTWMPASRDNWSKLEPDQHVVYGLPEGKELSTSPSFPPDDNQTFWRGQSQYLATGELEGAFTFTATGAPEGRLRRALAGQEPADRQSVFDASFARLASNAVIEKVGYVQPLDFDHPMEVSAEYNVPGYVLGTGSRRLLKLPLMQTVLADRVLSDLLDKTKEKERKYGLRLWATRHVSIDETVRLPEGWKIADSPKPAKIDGPAAALDFEITVDGAEIRYTCDLKIKRWTVPPEEYANFKQVMEKFAELSGRVVACETEVGDE